MNEVWDIPQDHPYVPPVSHWAGEELAEDTPVFTVTVAAGLASMHPQTLRQYDKMGLVVPSRTKGGVRRYSLLDISRLREVARLSAQGVSLPGIARVVEQQMEISMLKRRIRELEIALADDRLARRGRVFESRDGEVIAVKKRFRQHMRRAPKKLERGKIPPNSDIYVLT